MIETASEGTAFFLQDCAQTNPNVTPSHVTPRSGHWKDYEFTILPQEQTQWCWAAVAASVSKLYDAKPVSQLQVASGQLERNDCTKGNRCNRDGYLMAALKLVGHLREWDALTPATQEQVYTEVDKQRPLCARLLWSYGVGHFVIIVGYAQKDQSNSRAGLAIADPFWGLSDIDHEDFPTLYAYGATWTDTYFTKPRGEHDRQSVERRV
jgi:hypothetical protein